MRQAQREQAVSALPFDRLAPEDEQSELPPPHAVSEVWELCRQLFEKYESGDALYEDVGYLVDRIGNIVGRPDRE